MRRGSHSHTEWQHQPLQWKTCSCALDQTKSIIFSQEERTASAHPPAMTHQPPGSSISPWCGQTATEKSPENTPSTLSLLPASCVQLERYDAFCPSFCSPSLLVGFSFFLFPSLRLLGSTSSASASGFIVLIEPPVNNDWSKWSVTMLV